MTGGEVWSFGELPEIADSVYPGLVDEGETVGMRAFLEKDEAAESHRAGCVRLFMLDQSEQAAFVRKQLPLGPSARLYAPILSANGELPEDLLRCAAEGAMGSLPRTEEEFSRVSREGKSRLYECAQALAEGLEQAVESYRRISEWMERHRADPHLGEVARDLDEELAWLWRAGFAWKAGYGRMRRYQRFFYGIEERLQRLDSQPLVRDEEKQARIQPLWEEWIAQWTAHPEAVRFWEPGWMLEELRLLLFAPGQPREMRVSEKKIGKILEELR